MAFSLQPSFLGGEFSPSLHHRVDIQKYFSGLRKARNFIIHPYGGASNRPGTKFVAEVKDSTKKTRLVSFIYSKDQSYVLEFGHLYIRLFRDGGKLLSGMSPLEVETPYTQDDVFNLKFAQSNDYLYIVHQDHAPKVLIRSSDVSWNLLPVDLKYGPFMGVNSTSIKMWTDYSVNELKTSSAFFNSLHVGAIFKINEFVPTRSTTATVTVSSTKTIMAGTIWRLKFTGSFTTCNIKVYQSEILDGGSFGNEYLIREESNVQLDIFGEVGYPSSIKVVATVSGGTGNLILTSDAFEYSSIHKVISYISSTRVEVEAVKIPLDSDVFGVGVETLDWQEGAFSDYRGYPSVVWFYQDRLCFAATPSEQQSTWYSQTGAYTDFSTSIPLVDSDSISLNLPSRTQNAIYNVVPISNNLVFTSANEWTVGPGNSGVFTPTSVEQRIQGYRGSSKVSPLIVGGRLIYVQSMGATIRDLAFDFGTDSFAGSDLTIFSSHLFKGYQVVEMAYQQEPDSIVWSVRNDGKLVSMTYMKEQEVLAWTWHDTDGLFESICSIPEGSYDQPWVIVKRGNKRFVEYFVNRNESLDPKDQFFVDCGISYNGVPASTITGLTHLEGKNVKILGDGFVMSATVSSGQITLPIQVSKAHIGLPYVSDLETLDLELQGNDGTSMAKKSHISQILIRVLNSRGGYFGREENNLYEFINRQGEALDTPIDLYTGMIKEPLDSYYDYGGRVFIRQSHPLPLTVLAIIPKITVGG